MVKNKGTYKSINDETPPVMKTWNRLYGFVLLFLAFLIVLFYSFTKVFE